MSARVLSAALGLWLMAAPSALAYAGASRVSHLVVGPIVAAVSIVAMWPVTRPLRWLNLLAGLWLLLSPWGFTAPEDALWNSVLVGVALIGLSFVRGHVKERFGGGWSALVREPR